GIAERKAMIDRDHELSVSKQAEALQTFALAHVGTQGREKARPTAKNAQVQLPKITQRVRAPRTEACGNVNIHARRHLRRGAGRPRQGGSRRAALRSELIILRRSRPASPAWQAARPDSVRLLLVTSQIAALRKSVVLCQVRT